MLTSDVCDVNLGCEVTGAYAPLLPKPFDREAVGKIHIETGLHFL